MKTLALAAALGLFAAPALADHPHSPQGHSHGAPSSEAVSTVAADVRTVDVENRTAVLRHEAMPELAMSAMVMEFAIAADVDIDLFEPGAALVVTVRNAENGLEVVAAEPETAQD